MRVRAGKAVRLLRISLGVLPVCPNGDLIPFFSCRFGQIPDAGFPPTFVLLGPSVKGLQKVIKDLRGAVKSLQGRVRAPESDQEPPGTCFHTGSGAGKIYRATPAQPPKEVAVGKYSGRSGGFCHSSETGLTWSTRTPRGTMWDSHMGITIPCGITIWDSFVGIPNGNPVWEGVLAWDSRACEGWTPE